MELLQGIADQNPLLKRILPRSQPQLRTLFLKGSNSQMSAEPWYGGPEHAYGAVLRRLSNRQYDLVVWDGDPIAATSFTNLLREVICPGPPFCL